MKQAVLSKNQDLLLDTFLGSSKEPLCRVLCQDDSGDWQNLDDVVSVTVTRRGVDTRVGAFSYLPPVSDISVSMLNKGQKYSPGSLSKFDGLLTLNRPLRVLEGYRVGPVETGAKNIDLAQYGKTLYHTKVISGKVFNNIDSSPFPPSLTGFSFNTYGSGTYGSSHYEYDGYFLTRPIDLEALGTEIIEGISFDSDTDRIEVWYRSARTEGDLDLLGFTFLSDTVPGTKTAKLPFLSSRFFQFVFLWKSGIWSQTSNFLSGLRLEYRNGEVLFEQGIFFSDRPSFSSSRGKATASFKARDFLKKALAMKISLPEMVDVDIMEVVRKTCDKTGIPYTEKSLPLIGKIVTLAGDDIYKNELVQTILEECITFIASIISPDYRLVLGDDGRLTLTRKPLVAVVADHVLHYAYDLFSCEKGFSDNSLLQRATFLKKDASTDPNLLLLETLLTQTGEHLLSWPDPAIFKEVEVYYNDSDESTRLEIVESDLTELKLRIDREGGSAVKVRIKIFGDIYTSEVPYSGESFVSVNHIISRKKQGKNGTLQARDGQTVKWINRFLASDAEAKLAATRVASQYGNPKFQLSVTVRGMPQAEINDKFMVFEENSMTNSIFVLDNLSLSFNGKGAAFKSTLSFSDLGFVLENFIFDRNGSLEGPLDIHMDSGYLLDQDLGYVKEDKTDYSFLFPVKGIPV